MATLLAPMPEVSVRAFPMLSEAARVLCIDPTTLGRWARGRTIENGDRAKRMEPQLVMEAAVHFKNVVLNDVARYLIEYAEEHAPEAVTYVKEAVEATFAPRDDNVDQFLEDAQQLLPEGLFEAVRAAVEQSARSAGAPIEGVSDED